MRRVRVLKAERLWVLAVAFSVLLAACGGGDDTGDAETRELVDAIAEDLRSEAQADGDIEFSEADAVCMAQAVVDAVGSEAIEDAGITAEAVRRGDDLPDLDTLGMDDATELELADAVADCIDFSQALGPAFAEDFGISTGSAECLLGRLFADESVRAMMVAGILGGITGEEAEDPFDDPPPAFLSAFLDATGECLTDEELGRLFE